MTRVETILLVFIISTLLLLRPQSSIAADTCPSASNVLFARLDFRDGTERNYLINYFDQAVPAASGNVAKLSFASNPDRWLVNGVQVSPAWSHKYSITYLGEGEFGRAQPLGDTWFSTLPDYPDVYFWFTFPVHVTGIETVGDVQQYVVEWRDHPNCAAGGNFGSIKRSVADELLKPRR